MLLSLLFSAALAAPSLTLAGACPGPVSVTASGFTPNGQVALVRGAGPGLTVAPPGVCGGTQLGLASPSVVAVGAADAAGGRTWTTNLGAAACATELVAVDLTTCAVAAPVSLRPRPAPWEVSYDLIYNGDASFMDLEPMADGWAWAVETTQGPMLLQLDDRGATRDVWTLPMAAVDALAPTADGGWLVAGAASALDDPALVRLSSTGAVRWARAWDDGTADLGFFAADVASDGRFLAAGPWEIGVSPSGVEQWRARHIGDDGHVNSVEAMPGGWLLAGQWIDAAYAGPSHAVVTRLDLAGQTVWSRSYAGGDWDWPHTALPTADGGAVVTGWSFSFDDQRSCFLTRLDAAGDVRWSRAYTTPGGTSCADVAQTADGGFALTGFVSDGPSPVDDLRLLLLRTDADGHLLSATTHGPGGGVRLAASARGGLLVVGWRAGDLALRALRTDPLGRTGCEQPVALVEVDAPWTVTPWASAADPVLTDVPLAGGVGARPTLTLPVCL